MVRDAGLLLRLYWRLNRRERGGLSVPVRIVYYLLALILIIISALAGYAAGLVVGNPFVPITLGRGTAPGLFLTIVLIGLLFTGFNQALRALFLSGDLERLMVAPVSTPAVMTAKLLSRLPGTTFFLLAITLPALLTYGIGVGEGPSVLPGRRASSARCPPLWPLRGRPGGPAFGSLHARQAAQ